MKSQMEFTPRKVSVLFVFTMVMCIMAVCLPTIGRLLVGAIFVIVLWSVIGRKKVALRLKDIKSLGKWAPF